jgi:hypothetical protein
MGMKFAKEWVNCEVTFYGESQKQHKESSCHKAIVKLAEKARKEKLETVCLKSVSRKKDV